MVRVLGTMILLHLSRASTTDCDQVAKAVIQNFHFWKNMRVIFVVCMKISYFLWQSDLILYMFDVRIVIGNHHQLMNQRLNWSEWRQSHKSIHTHHYLVNQKMTPLILVIWHFCKKKWINSNQAIIMWRIWWLVHFWMGVDFEFRGGNFTNNWGLPMFRACDICVSLDYWLYS